MVVEWWSVLPFVILLLSIAVLPLLPATEHAWEKNSVKLLVALACGIPVALWFVIAGHGGEVVHALFEYVQFIMLLLALFVVSGGIFLAGDIRATPRNNTIFLAIGGVIASFIGTTGAAMLLIRPLLNTNKERAHRVHTVVFTIFIVANCGGLLTPLGDPPLFLGFLRGVPFEWTFRLWVEWLFVNALLLLTYYALDRRAYARETDEAIAFDETDVTPLRIRGEMNFVFFAVIIAAVAFVPSLDLHAIETGHATLAQMVPWRELVFLAAALGSYLLGDREVRFSLNQFTWAPILEVAALFIGIFLAMIPALNFLGQVAPQLPLNEVTFFVFSGGLSAFLDNAPTYATFFEMASQLPGEPRIGMAPGVPEAYLVAISLGSVLCGAITYIGNGPNFMTKAVADSAGVAMPSFGGYLRWSLMYLVPILIAMVAVFIADGIVWTILGLLLAGGIGARAVRLARSNVHPSEMDD
ncbi:sodium:proton antiporter [Propioniciclava coleopterorum]|uniref:Sodium:proton antiporter n=1 Tax=Propioniciclava coleopterorum TaxID=2714937 RepID=A0A6G7Y6G8_9ACTN|nr:sodium:proton antiporter [Propioniciclava coleopterorum]QIK72412.1 sodium:proton antiporter [Propioniciclava coleopterorum]